MIFLFDEGIISRPVMPQHFIDNSQKWFVVIATSQRPFNLNTFIASLQAEGRYSPLRPRSNFFSNKKSYQKSPWGRTHTLAKPFYPLTACRPFGRSATQLPEVSPASVSLLKPVWLKRPNSCNFAKQKHHFGEADKQQLAQQRMRKALRNAESL